MLENPDTDKRRSPAEELRRSYGAEQDADTEEAAERRRREPDTRANLYEDSPKRKVLENETDLEKAARLEQEELDGLRPE